MRLLSPLLWPVLLALGTAPVVLAASEAETEAKDRPVPPLERLVPIPGYSPPVEDNGCRVRKDPSEPQAPDRRGIPFWELVSDHVGHHAITYVVAKDDPRGAFRQEVAPLRSELKTLVTLYALWDGLGRDGLHTFFYMGGGTIAHEVLAALAEAGLAREQAIFAEAMALFGPVYPVDERDREKWFGYDEGNGELNAFDMKLLALAERFPTEEALARSIEGFVVRHPELWREIEARRNKLGTQRRVRILASLLVAKLPGDVPDPKPADLFARLGPEERTLLLLDLFNDELENGGVHQFFFNSSGDYAPDVHDALVAAGLTRQAGLLKRGMEMFKSPPDYAP